MAVEYQEFIFAVKFLIYLRQFQTELHCEVGRKKSVINIHLGGVRINVVFKTLEIE